MARPKQDITKTAAFREVLREFRKRYLESKAVKKTNSVFVIELGEVDNPDSSDEIISVLEYLKKEGAIKRYDISTYKRSITFGDEFEDLDIADQVIDLHLAKATCRVAPKQLQVLLQKHSLLPVFALSYNKRELVINGGIVLVRTQFESKNDQVLEYLFAHSGETFKPSELSEALHMPIRKRPVNFANELIRRKGSKLRGYYELRKLFFPVTTKRAISFRKVVYQSDMEDAHIDEEKLRAELQDLKSLK